MDNLFFFPIADDQMLTDAGCYCSEYEFRYSLDGEYKVLKQKGKSNIKLQDPLDVWSIENDGLRVMRLVTIEYPEVLKGPSGVACADSEIGVCIVWSNRALKQMGYIKPTETVESEGKMGFIFFHDFNAGEIQGDLTLDTVLYIKRAARTVLPEEKHLINDAGVTVGIIDSFGMNFSNTNMEFPIIDVNDKQQPLWWLELDQWEDPRENMFNEDYVRLYLNSHYDCCPKVGETIKNLDLLIEIISSAYFLIFKKIEDMGFKNDTLNDINLEPGSISKVMFYFYSSHIFPLKFESDDQLMKSIHRNVEAMLKGSDEE